jgi:hypothetical protein
MSVAFTDDETVAFLNGAWVDCRSNNPERNIVRAQYNADASTLTLEFKDGAFYNYRCSWDLAEDFARAESKGGWRHKHFPGKTYIGVYRGSVG